MPESVHLKVSPLNQMIQIFVKPSFVADNLLVVCTSLLLQSSQTLNIRLFRRHQKLVRDPKCVYLRCVSPVPSAGWFSSGKVVGRNISRSHLAEKRFSRLRKGFFRLRRDFSAEKGMFSAEKRFFSSERVLLFERFLHSLIKKQLN